MASLVSWAHSRGAHTFLILTSDKDIKPPILQSVQASGARVQVKQIDWAGLGCLSAVLAEVGPRIGGLVYDITMLQVRQHIPCP